MSKIVLRVDGHRNTGMGHVSRMIVLGRHLKKLDNVDIVFVTKNAQPTIDLISKHGFQLHVLEFNLSVEQELIELGGILILEEPHVIIIDVLGLSDDNHYLNGVKDISDAVVISFTDTHGEMPELSADIVINSSILQFGGRISSDQQYYLGLDYCLLSPEYANVYLLGNRLNTVKRVMVCMGGVDHNNLTLKILKGLDASLNTFEFDVILSSSYTDKRKLSEITKSMSHAVRVHYDVDGIYGILCNVDFAVTAGGNAHSERICAGVPGLVISQEAHQYGSAMEYERYGATINLGIHSQLNEDELLRSFNTLFESSRLQNHMVKCGRALVDGLGLQRISDIIMGKNKSY